jgi:hypothetical protein
MDIGAKVLAKVGGWDKNTQFHALLTVALGKVAEQRGCPLSGVNEEFDNDLRARGLTESEINAIHGID